VPAGIARYQAGEYTHAARLFQDVLARTPDDADALRLCGLSLVRAGRAAEGLPLLARAVARAPHVALTHLHHGIGLLDAARPARAAARFRRAAQLEPDMAAAWINLSAALLALAQPQAARAAARRALRLGPADPEALHACGKAQFACGDLDAAHQALSDSIRRAPGRVDAWIDLGLVHARRGRLYLARQAMERALLIAPGHGPATANIAAFNMVIGQALDSITTLTQLLERDPGCIAARLNLANALLFERDAPRALEVLSGPPPRGREGIHWQAYRVLALLLTGRINTAADTLAAIPQPYGDAEILIVSRRMQLARLTGDAATQQACADQLEAMIAQEDVWLFEHRVLAAFDLARIRSTQGDHRGAFALWRTGHRLMTRVQPFSRAGFADFVDASIQQFDEAWLQAARADNADPAPVFIVGLPRSGTTLTEQILASHASVFGAGERGAVQDLVVRLGGPSLEAATIRRLAMLTPDALSEVARGFLTDLHAQAPRARYVIDKMPANALYLGFLAALLPGARFILTRRDLRDTGLSIFQHRFFGYHPYAHDLGDLGFFMAEQERLLSHWKPLLGERLIEVALDDWVGDFAGTLARLEAFLDLPHDPACARFHENRRVVRTASAAQVRQPINARGLGRWHRHAQDLAPMIAELELGRVPPLSTVGNT